MATWEMWPGQVVWNISSIIFCFSLPLSFHSGSTPRTLEKEWGTSEFHLWGTLWLEISGSVLWGWLPGGQTSQEFRLYGISIIGFKKKNNSFSCLCVFIPMLKVQEAPPMSQLTFRSHKLKPSEVMYFQEYNFTLEHFSSKFLIRNGRPLKNLPKQAKEIGSFLHWS